MVLLKYSLVAKPYFAPLNLNCQQSTPFVQKYKINYMPRNIECFFCLNLTIIKNFVFVRQSCQRIKNFYLAMPHGVSKNPVGKLLGVHYRHNLHRK